MLGCLLALRHTNWVRRTVGQVGTCPQVAEFLVVSSTSWHTKKGSL
jgi:hypothetical protein